MRRVVWLVYFFLGMALGLGLPHRLSASDNLVEVILLYDSAQLLESGDRWRAAELGRDLVNNLPARASVEAFRRGERQDLIPLGMDLLNADSLIGAPAGTEQTTLQQALLEAERRLCARRQGEDFPDKVLVVVGRGTGDGRLKLAGVCQVTVYSVSTNSEDDPVLRELAEQNRGAYYSLNRAKGYIVAKAIRVSVWMPRLLRNLRRESAERGEYSALGFYISFIVLIVILLSAFFAYLRSSRSGRAVVPKREVAQPVLPEQAPALEVGLKICSEQGQGIFWFESREAVILGGRQADAAEQADLVLDDPLVSGEHCRIYRKEGRFFAADLESKVGTFVNGEKLLEPMALSSGDELRIGCSRFELVVREA